jgi:LysM repeat protein
MQRKFIIFFFLFISATTKILAQKEVDVLAYIATYKDIAMKEMQRTGVPAAIKLAQGIHETEAGKSDLVLKSKNHFGIKCKANWNGEKVFHDDDSRGECFRSYDKPEQSYMDHSDFLRNSPRYAFLFDLDPTDYEGWAYGLRKAGYATNIKYSQILINLIHTYKLQDYSLIAIGRMKESDHMLASGRSLIPNMAPIVETAAIAAGPEAVARVSYPVGIFNINNTKVVFAEANTPWLVLAEQYDIPLSRLLDFNDLEKDDDLLLKPQLIYLQRKRKVGSAEFHLMKAGEDLYDICQVEGIRFESLLELNHLNGNLQPATGEKLNLQYAAATAPRLVSEQKNKLAITKAPEKGVYRMSNTGTPEQLNSNVSNVAAASEYDTHLVSTRETLYSISKKYGIEPEKIMKWNGLVSMNLKTGQSLIIYKNN